MNFSALRHFLHFVWDLLDDELKAMVEVIGDLFDEVEADVDYVTTQIDPGAADIAGTLPDFERFHKIPVYTGSTLEERRNRVKARIRARGPLNFPKFYQIAAALGYSIGSGIKYLSVIEGEHKPFRAGYSQAGIDAVWDQTVGNSMYDVIIRGTAVETDTELQYLVNKLRAQGINFIYENV